MKKAKLRTASSKVSPSSRPVSAKSTSAKSALAEAAQRKVVDLAEIRRQITDLVGIGAVGMVETTMEEVGKGHYLGMKYLFEMIGLYPAIAAEDAPAQDSLAATLLRRLGLAEEPTVEPGVTKDSTSAMAAAEDVLE
jgi:hypothetical protein